MDAWVSEVQERGRLRALYPEIYMANQDDLGLDYIFVNSPNVSRFTLGGLFY